MGRSVRIFIPKDCNMIFAFETEEELLEKVDNKKILPLYGYKEYYKEEFPNLYLAYAKGPRANKTPVELERMDAKFTKAVKIAEYVLSIIASAATSFLMFYLMNK